MRVKTRAIPATFDLAFNRDTNIFKVNLNVSEVEGEYGNRCHAC
jgi:hypothetical protein